MNCPECGGEMHPDEVQGWIYGQLLIVRVLVCKDAMCRVVVINDWRWKAAAAGGDPMTTTAVTEIGNCDMCHAQAKLQEAMDAIEAIPDFDISLFDDPITRAFEALEIAFSTLTHYPHDEVTQ